MSSFHYRQDTGGVPAQEIQADNCASINNIDVTEGVDTNQGINFIQTDMPSNVTITTTEDELHILRAELFQAEVRIKELKKIVKTLSDATVEMAKALSQ